MPGSLSDGENDDKSYLVVTIPASRDLANESDADDEAEDNESEDDNDFSTDDDLTVVMFPTPLKEMEPSSPTPEPTSLEDEVATPVCEQNPVDTPPCSDESKKDHCATPVLPSRPSSPEPSTSPPPTLFDHEEHGSDCDQPSTPPIRRPTVTPSQEVLERVWREQGMGAMLALAYASSENDDASIDHNRTSAGEDQPTTLDRDFQDESGPSFNHEDGRGAHYNANDDSDQAFVAASSQASVLQERDSDNEQKKPAAISNFVRLYAHPHSPDTFDAMEPASVMAYTSQAFDDNNDDDKKPAAKPNFANVQTRSRFKPKLKPIGVPTSHLKSTAPTPCPDDRVRVWFDLCEDCFCKPAVRCKRARGW